MEKNANFELWNAVTNENICYLDTERDAYAAAKAMHNIISSIIDINVWCECLGKYIKYDRIENHFED